MSPGSRRRRARGRRGSDLELNADINVTSLVDVAFTLLVIFIITAPILQGGIEVAIPRADVRPLTAADAPIFITIRPDGRVFLEESEVTIEALEAGLAQIVAAGGAERVYVQADSLAPWAPIIRAMAAAVNSGVGWSAVAEPFTETR